MSENTRSTTRLRDLLRTQEILLAPGAFDPMAARLVERAGFQAVYVTGGGSALAMHGLPDLELTSQAEAVDTVETVVRSVGIPVIADADTGYGNPLNVRRTVQLFERAGVAAMHIEDQLSPKKCGQYEGKHLIATEEMVQKLRAAVDARSDPDLLLIARTDALAVSGFEDAMARGRAYAAAGADMVFVEAPRSPQEVRAIADELRGIPLLFNQSASGKTPFLTAKEVGAMGYRLMIFPNFATLSAIAAIRGVLGIIKETGSAAGVRASCATLDEMHDLAGTGEMEILQARYAAPVAEKRVPSNARQTA